MLTRWKKNPARVPGFTGVPERDRHRFRMLAEHADAVEEALSAGVVSRKALLERIQYQPGAGAVTLALGLCSTLVADPQQVRPAWTAQGRIINPRY